GCRRHILCRPPRIPDREADRGRRRRRLLYVRLQPHAAPPPGNWGTTRHSGRDRARAADGLRPWHVPLLCAPVPQGRPHRQPARLPRRPGLRHAGGNAMVDLAVDIGALRLKNPIMPASGTFSEDLADVFDLDLLGAHVTKTITRGWR